MKKPTKAKRTQQLAKAMAHPLRVQILTKLQQGISSPNRLAQELKEPLGNVSYHVKTLLEYDCVELVKTEPRRGAVEHFYKTKGIVTVAEGATLSIRQQRLVADVMERAMSNGIAAQYTDNDRRELEAAAKILKRR